MAYSLEINESLPDGLFRVVREEIDLAVGNLTEPAELAVGVHEARKGIKRLRAIVHLLRPVLGEEWYERENGRLRQISHRLGPLREAEALLELLAALPADAAELAPIRQILEDEKGSSLAAFTAAGIAGQAAEALQTAGRALVDLPLPAGTAPFDLIAGGLRRVYRQGRERMARAYAAGDQPHLFHDWRKRVKYLWHHTELLTPFWPPIFTPLAEEIHHLSDFLGDAHDLAELRHKLAEELQPPPASLIDLLLERQQVLEQQARPLGQRIYAEKPAAYERRLRGIVRSRQLTAVSQ